jgi:hypothetical protein
MFRAIRKKIFRLAFVSGIGAAASYFFDKDKGEERRAQAKEKANGLMGKAGGAGGSWQPTAEHSANGFEPQVVATSPSPTPAPPVSDVVTPPTAGDFIGGPLPGTVTSPTVP